MVGFEPTTVPQAIDTEEDIVSVLSPPLISNSLSVGFEPEETSVVHSSTSPRRLFATMTAYRPCWSTRDPDEIGGSRSGGSRSVGNIPRTSLPEPEETSVTQLSYSVPVPVFVPAATLNVRTKMPQREFV